MTTGEYLESFWNRKIAQCPSKLRPCQYSEGLKCALRVLGMTGFKCPTLKRVPRPRYKKPRRVVK